MSDRTLAWLVGALVALAAVYGIVILASGDGGGEVGGALAEEFAAIDRDRVDSIRFVQPAGTVVLHREGDRWFVDGHRADSASIARFWSTMEEANVGEVVSMNPANHSKLGIEESQAVRVELHASGEELAAFLVGKSGPTYPSVYARMPGADEVHVAEVGLRGPSMRGVDGWRDKTVVRTDTAAVRRIAVERPDGGYLLERAEEGWTVDGSAADAGAVRNVLSELARLTASGFAGDTAAFEAGELRSVTALGEAGDTLSVVRISGSDGGPFLARTPEGETTYRLQAFRVDRLAPGRSDVAGGGGG